jgi:RNA-directed DNA polymerase
VNVSNSITPLKGERLTDNQPKLQWTDINWKMVKEHVNRLQTRIAKAVKQGKWNLVKRLRYLLTHSFYAKLLAVKRVTQNRGKRTAGIDGEKWTTPNSKMNAALKLFAVTRSYIINCLVLPLPSGVILLRYASVVMLRCRALRTIWRNLIV